MNNWRRGWPLSAIHGFRGTSTSMCVGIDSRPANRSNPNFIYRGFESSSPNKAKDPAKGSFALLAERVGLTRAIHGACPAGALAGVPIRSRRIGRTRTLFTVGSNFAPAIMNKAPNGALFIIGGEGGIRTHGTRKSTTDFESVPIDHSGTSPIYRYSYWQRCALQHNRFDSRHPWRSPLRGALRASKSAILPICRVCPDRPLWHLSNCHSEER